MTSRVTRTRTSSARRQADGPFTVFPGQRQGQLPGPDQGAEQPADVQPDRHGIVASRRPARPTYISSDGSFVPVLGSLGEDPRRYNWVSAPVTSTATGRATWSSADNGGEPLAAPRDLDKGFGATRPDRLRVRRATRSAADRAARSSTVARSSSRRAGQVASVGMPEQHDRAPVHHRRQEGRDSGLGRRVHVGEQPDPAWCSVSGSLLQQVGLGPRALGGDPGDRVRAGGVERR